MLIDESASENTKKRFRNACIYYAVPLMCFDTAHMDVPSAVGRPRGKLVAVTDDAFADMLKKLAVQVTVGIRQMIQGVEI